MVKHLVFESQILMILSELLSFPGPQSLHLYNRYFFKSLLPFSYKEDLIK